VGNAIIRQIVQFLELHLKRAYNNSKRITMENELYRKLSSILCKYPTINQFLGGDYLRRQCKSGLKPKILSCLAQADTDEKLQNESKFLQSLDSQLAELSCVPGFDKLEKGLRRTSWEEVDETLVQIDTTIWFSQRHLLKEIEPELPHRRGSCDLLISLKQNDIYCEVTSRRSPQGNSQIPVKKIQKAQKRQPWRTELDLTCQLEIGYVLQSLHQKAKDQLPLSSPGILALETNRAMIFQRQTKDLADKLFASKSQSPVPQVILIMLWNLERGSNVGEGPF
jgi:hypothetical protein